MKLKPGLGTFYIIPPSNGWGLFSTAPRASKGQNNTVVGKQNIDNNRA